MMLSLSNLKIKTLLFSIFTLLLFSFVYLALSLQSSTLSTPAKAQETVDYQCVGKGVAEYMNAVIAGAGNLKNVKLLSPAFNMTSRHFDGIINAMADNNANFGGLAGIAGNAYNFAGSTVTGHVERAMSNSNLSGLGKPVMVTETGKIDFGLPELAQELGYIKSKSHNGITYLGAQLFNAFNTNPSWNSFALSDGELDQVCSGSCGNIGVNSATFFSQSDAFYTRGGDHQMGFTLEIAKNDTAAAIDGIRKAHERGMTTVIRIGVMNDSGGFTNPNDYVSFLKAIDLVAPRTVYAIAGPNEPESESWATPNCQALESPVNNPKCNEVSDPEFHTLRPYPANPCDISIRETTFMCSNQFVSKETFRVRRGQATSCTGSECTFNMKSTISTSVNLNTAFLPIMGNTELVPNSTTQTDSLTPAQRVNDYVSWYLNGVISPAEEENRTFFQDRPEELVNKLVNFSGPLKKLLPWRIQTSEKVEEIDEADRSRRNALEEGEAGRHDQIVGCSIGLGGITIPSRCYSAGIIQDITRELHRLTDWLTHKPPIREDLTDFQEYLRQDCSWRGSVLSLNVFGIAVCSHLSANNFWSNLFPNIPQSSTEDRIGTLETREPPTSKSSGGVNITNIQYTPATGGEKEILYFAHMEEVAELSSSLQKTFTPRGESGNTNTNLESESPTIGPGCTIVETRTNPGDKLHADRSPETISGTLTYDAEFKCTFPPPDVDAIVDCVNQGGTVDDCSEQESPGTCEKEVFVGIPMEGQTPKIEEIWNRLVEGDFSVFKRIFPQVGPDTPFGAMKDIPAVTTGTYTATGGAAGSTVTAIAGDESAQRPGTAAEIYFPHVGSLHEYFLRGIQTALRPKGFAEGPLAGLVPPPGSTDPNDPGTGTPGDPGQPGDSSCNVIEGNSPYCSVGYLSKPDFFGTTAKARIASRICNRESGANPFVVRDTCASSGDVSIGLFQINIRAHSLVHPGTGETLVCPAAYSGGSASNVGNCTVVNETLKQKCIEALKNYPDYQIKKAVEISGNGTNWNAWSVYKVYAACRVP